MSRGQGLHRPDRWNKDSQRNPCVFWCEETAQNDLISSHSKRGDLGDLRFGGTCWGCSSCGSISTAGPEGMLTGQHFHIQMPQDNTWIPHLGAPGPSPAHLQPLPTTGSCIRKQTHAWEGESTDNPISSASDAWCPSRAAGRVGACRLREEFAECLKSRQEGLELAADCTFSPCL